MTTALITGASVGIGAAFARRLAADGYDLILTARNTERLNQNAAALREHYGVTVEVLPANLATSEETARVETRLADTGRPVDMLVNNAGFSTGKSFLGGDIEAEERMLNVLVRAVLRLSSAALPGMVKRGQGAIVNIASIAAYVPWGTYGAAKAWVTSFSEGLYREVAGTGVKILAVCPGATRTEFQQRAGLDFGGIPPWMWLTAEQVVDSTLKGLRRGATVITPSVRYKAVVIGARHTPRWLLGWISSQVAPLTSRSR